MKLKILLFATLLIGGTTLAGCDNDDDTPNDYYIHYTAKADIGEAVTISYTDENGKTATTKAPAPTVRYNTR